MQMLVATVALTGAGAGVTLIGLFKDGAGNNITKASKLDAEPDISNSHVSYIGDKSMNTSTSIINHVSKILQIPKASQAAGDAAYDRFTTGTPIRQPMLDLGDYTFQGTNGEKIRVTIWVG
jgi:hypothetical protein